MAEKSFPLNNTDYGAEDAQLYFATRTRGVFAGDHLSVTAGNGMTVTLGEGIAWLKNGEFGGLVYGNTAPISLPIGTANATYPRIDRVVIRYDVQTNTVAAYVKAGTPASSPVPPALTRDTLADEISVAQVYVAVAATSISAGNITDERLNEEVCGLMRDGVTGIDTSVIEAQWQAKLKELDEQIANEGVVTRKRIFRTFSSSEWSLLNGMRKYSVTLRNEAIKSNSLLLPMLLDSDRMQEFLERRIFFENPGDGYVGIQSDTKDQFMLTLDVINGMYLS